MTFSALFEREWVIRPGPYDAIKQLLLSDFVGDRLHALLKLPLGDLPVAVRVHGAPCPPRLRERHAVDFLHGLLLLDFVDLSILVLVQHREPGESVRGERANFTRLVMSCIEAKFCKKICVRKISPRSTQCTPSHRFGIDRSLISKFSLKKLLIFFCCFFPKIL